MLIALEGILEDCKQSFCTYAHCLLKEVEGLISYPDPESIPVTRLLQTLSTQIRFEADLDHERIIKRLNDLLNLAKEKFYAYPFKDVPSFWRDIFRCASFLKATVLMQVECENSDRAAQRYLEDEALDEIVAVLDMALIMVGKPIDCEHVGEMLDELMDVLRQCHKSHTPESERNNQKEIVQPPGKRRKLEDPQEWGDCFSSNTSTFVPQTKCPIRRATNLNLEEFQAHIDKTCKSEQGAQPLVIRGSIDHWPAYDVRPWKSPSYLLSRTIGGRRLVPVELGRSYVDSGWGQKIMPFKPFVNDYILNPKPDLGTGYLAQHDFLSQIPALRNDIAIPDFCYATVPPPHHSSPHAAQHAAIPQLDDPLLNTWFGPAGTISPLHTDPYHNILAQVVGRKYVRLYAPGESSKLYARGIEEGGIDMHNTSSIDVGLLEGWDGSEAERKEALERFPLYREASFVECILEEGECLYIPVGWWHYVRSLSVSFNVSFWWN